MKKGILTLLVSLSFVANGFADPVLTPRETQLEARIAALEKQVALLTRVQEVNKEVQIKKDTETPIVKANQDGFALQSQDQNFTVKFKGLVQADGRYYANDNTAGGSNTYLIRRLRPILEGTVYKYFDYRLMPDFGSNQTVLQDAYIDFKYWPAASLRAGKFKSPLGIERLQPDAVGRFVETALSTNLTPNRDIGVDLHGDLFDEVVSYDLGIFNGAPDGANADASDAHDDKEVVGRIFTQPFKNTSNDALNGLGVGLGGSWGSSHGSTNSIPTYRSDGQQNIFTYAPSSGTVTSDGPRYRLAPQGSYYYGPFGFLAEWVLASEQLKNGTSTARINNRGWQAAGSYILTGENASYKDIVNPRKPFDPKKNQWGAFEVASRFSLLDIDKDAFPTFANPLTQVRGARAWGLGLNWYLNKNIKVMTDFFQTFFDNGGPTAGADRKTENAILTRIQLSI